MNEMFTLEIPKDVENLQLPNPTLLDYYKDTEQRTFWLEGEVNDETLELVKTIMRINHEDEKYKMPIEERVPIKIFHRHPRRRRSGYVDIDERNRNQQDSRIHDCVLHRDERRFVHSLRGS